MRLEDKVAYSLRNLRQTQMRSWLTMLGIVVGVTALIVLVGLAEGLKSEVSGQLEGFGSQTIVVIPMNIEDAGSDLALTAGFSATSGRLYEKDVQKLKKVAGIELVTSVIIGRGNVEYKSQQVAASVFGIEPILFKQTVGSLEIEKGRFMESNDKGVAVLGSGIAEDGFEEKVDVNSQIKIGNKKFRVIGILKETGNSFAQTDSVIYISFEEAKDIFSSNLAKNEVNAISIYVKEEFDVKEVSEEIEFELANAHKVPIDEKDFGLITPEFINESVNSVLDTLSIFLGILAEIALVVGGIGNSNTMFMNVWERRREIGVLKAIGSDSEEILSLFLLESSLLGVVGGIIGIIIGAIILGLISLVGGLTTIVSVELVLVGMTFSAVLGAVSGSLPAKQAADVSPVESLRWE